MPLVSSHHCTDWQLWQIRCPCGATAQRPVRMQGIRPGWRRSRPRRRRKMQPRKMMTRRGLRRDWCWIMWRVTIPLSEAEKEKKIWRTMALSLQKRQMAWFTVHVYHFSFFTDFTDVNDSFTRLLFTAKLYMYTVAVFYLLFSCFLLVCTLSLYLIPCPLSWGLPRTSRPERYHKLFSRVIMSEIPT